MARIEGVDLPRNKRVEVGLTYLFGIGLTRSQEILAATKVNPDIRIKDLSESDVAAIREYISKHYTVEGDLRREVQLNIKRLIEIGSYRGLRHRRNLPTRGQRSRTNARDGKLILVTAMTPTPAGEGKTTTSIGLCEGLNKIGKKTTVVSAPDRSLLEVLREDYVRTARAKGVGELLVLARHALRNAMIPIVTVIGRSVFSRSVRHGTPSTGTTRPLGVSAAKPMWKYFL